MTDVISEAATFTIPFDNLTGAPLKNRSGTPTTEPPSMICGSQLASTCPSPERSLARRRDAESPGASIGHSPYDSDETTESAALTWEAAAQAFQRHEKAPSKGVDSTALPFLLAELGVDAHDAGQCEAADRLSTAAANGPVGLLTYRAWWRKVLRPAIMSAQDARKPKVDEMATTPQHTFCLSTPQHKPTAPAFSTPERSSSALGRSMTPPPASPMPECADYPPLPHPATCPNTPIGAVPSEWPTDDGDEVEVVGPLQYATPPLPTTEMQGMPLDCHTFHAFHGPTFPVAQPAAVGGALAPVADHEPIVPETKAGPHILTVQFKYGRQGEFSYFEGIPPGTFIIVTGDRGEDMGMVMAARPAYEQSLRSLLAARRPATAAEALWWRKDLAEQEREARRICQDVIQRHGLPMRVVHAEFQFDMNKLTFHFTSRDAHPHFRDALNECYSIWKCRIWFARYSRCAQDVENRRAIISQSTPQSVAQGGTPMSVPQQIVSKDVTPNTVRRIVYVVRHVPA